MMFSAPIFLYLVPLAGLPVVFHLILKQKKRVVVFSTLMFFYRTDPKLNSHRKIRQWLLLLMRILLIAFMLLALSRPRFVSSMGLAGRFSMVVIVDNSASMTEAGSYDNDRSKLEYATEGARKLISALEGDSEAAVIFLVDEPGVPAADSLTSGKELLLDSLDKIKSTAATGDAGRALGRAFELLRSSKTGGGVVHVFSDMQQSEWAGDLGRANAGGAPISVYLHKVESRIRDEANVAIAGIQFPEEKVLPKHPFPIGLVLQNNSDTVANVRVNSIDNKGQKNTENVVVERGRAKIVDVETRPESSGYHWVKAWVEGDGFSADNEAGVGMFCEETATVLFGGGPEEFGVLPVALSPSREGQFTGMVVKFSLPEQLRQAAVKEKPIMIITTWTGMQLIRENSAWLQDYIENGGNLLVVPGIRLGPRAFSGQLPGWLGAGIKKREAYPRGAGLEMLTEGNNFWHRIRQAMGNRKGGSRTAPVVSGYLFHPLTLSDGFTPLLGVDFQMDPEREIGRLGSRKVVIAHKKLGKGNIYISGTAFTSRWNTLPSSGLLVVIAQRMAVAGSSSAEGTLSLVAGERPRGIRAQGGEVEVLSLVGDPMDWKGQEQEIPAFPRAGVYLITAGDNKYCMSVRASEKEGLERYIQGPEVPALEIAHEIIPYDEAGDFRQYHKGQVRSVELFLLLLLLATLALLAEGWLGAPRMSRAGREKTPEAAGSRKGGSRTARISRTAPAVGEGDADDTPVLSGESKNGGRAI